MATIDPKWLRRRYIHDGAEVATIAAEAGVDPSTIHRHLRAAGIPPRGKAGSRQPVIDPEFLKVRLAEGAAPYAIAAELRCDRSSVLWAAAAAGLLDLTPSDDPVTYRRATAAAVKYRRGQSLRAVAVAVGADRRQVSMWLRALGVPIRKRGRPTG